MSTMSRKAVRRREAIAAIGVAGAAVALGCGDSTTGPSGSTTLTGATSAGTCAVAPNETAGPFPTIGDFIRSDIRDGRPGTLLTLTLRAVNVSAGCAAVANANVEIWQCDAIGDYSQYGSQNAGTFLRGTQTTNANGEVTFTTIYPGWYQGRATHIHLEVLAGGRSVKVTQLAFPEATSNAVHAQGVYAGRGSNPTRNASDMVFADSLASQLVTPAGSVASGYTASAQIGVAL